MGSSCCFGVQNTLSQSPTPVVSSTNSSPARAAEGANEGVNSVSRFQGCHFCGGSLPGAVHFDSLPYGEGAGERGVPPSDQLESAEQIPSQGEVKMEVLHTTCSLLRRGDFMMKLDLKDAYNAVPIHPESRKYLWFYHEGRTRLLLPSFQPFTGSLLLHQNPPSHHSKTVLRGNTNSNLLV